MSGPEGIRTPDLLSAIDNPIVSSMSLALIWWFSVLHITICGGNYVLLVLIFHAVLPALQPVAAGLALGMKQEKQVQSISELVR